MKSIILILLIYFCYVHTRAQVDSSLTIRGGEKTYYLQKWVTASTTKILDKDSLVIILPNWIIEPNKPVYDAIIQVNALDTTQNLALPSSAKEKYASFQSVVGLSIGNLLEFNNPSGTGDKVSFSLNGSLDLMYRYTNPNSVFNTSHELHWTIGVQKESLGAGSDLQRAQDDVMTLHDVSLAFTKKKKWRFNLIAKLNTSIFTVFDNNYFKDLTGNGRNLSFLSPFSLILSPGIQYQPIEPLKISVSPYSTEFYGVSSDKVAARGVYITETDASGNYKQLITKRKALEFNIWFDHRVKEWLEMQYRMSLFSDYQLGFMNNGNAEGLLITRVKILKDIYLSHRFTIVSDIFNNIANPFITQNVQISLSKTF